MEFPADVPQHPSSVSHLDKFYGLPVLTFPQASSADPLPADPASVAWRMQCGMYTGDEASDDYWNRFTEIVPLEQVRALVIGSAWYGSDGWPDDAVEKLVGLSSRLTGLEALFLGDLEFEESEISWITQSDVAPLLEAYPRLRELGRGAAVRTSAFPAVRLEGLRTLRFETGGLPRLGRAHRGRVRSAVPGVAWPL
ncbi:STM4015 family protein [Streptomyces hirsutus]